MNQFPASLFILKLLFLNTTDTRGGAKCNGKHVCFPSLPSMLQCRFKSRLELEFSGFSMWHILNLIIRGFLPVLRFPPLLHQLMVQPIKQSKIKCDLNSVKLNSWAVPSFQVAHSIMHVINARCVAHDLQTIMPGPLKRMFWRQFVTQWGDCKNISDCTFQCHYCYYH